MEIDNAQEVNNIGIENKELSAPINIDKSPAEKRAERIEEIDREYKSFDVDENLSIEEIKIQRNQEFESKMQEMGKAEIPMSEDTKKLIYQNMVSDSIDQAKKENERFDLLNKEKNQLEKIGSAEELINNFGGEMDFKTSTYKNFDQDRYERFLIQKGYFKGKDVVFKIAEKCDGKTIKEESEKIQQISEAKIKDGEKLDIKLILQVGEIIGNEKMIGLATEYFNDNQELKRSLVSEQKIQIVSQVIKNLQKIELPEKARLDVSDAKNIIDRMKDLSKKMNADGFIDNYVIDKLTNIINANGKNLENEALVFCHGDVQGGNIFLNKNESGEFDIALSDFETLKISNKYHDWCEFFNKSALCKHIAENNPTLYEKLQKDIENIWADPGVKFDKDALIMEITEGDPVKVGNFRLTNIYDLLMRMSHDVTKSAQISKERFNFYSLMLNEEIDKFSNDNGMLKSELQNLISKEDFKGAEVKHFSQLKCWDKIKDFDFADKFTGLEIVVIDDEEKWKNVYGSNDSKSSFSPKTIILKKEVFDREDISDENLGWLIHEMGHIDFYESLGEQIGEYMKKYYAAGKYTESEMEQDAFEKQFQFLKSIGKSKSDCVVMMKKYLNESFENNQEEEKKKELEQLMKYINNIF
ncbi:MAG: hypothetical protein WCI36_00595 [bacterium]